jgi:magnesium-transporting ATPase (P-type)
MSVILETSDNQIMILTKGADSVIAKRLANGQKEELDAALEALEDYGKEGLRTLMLAQRIIPTDEFEKWEADYKKCLASMEGREEKIEDQQDLIEVNLDFVGCTAIEDKLQDEVPETIALLLKNNIKVWVLTGDKGTLDLYS